METITLPVPKARFRTMLICCLIVLVAPLEMLGSPLRGATTVACIAIVFLLSCIVYFALRMRSDAPMLVIDDTGLTDNASLLTAGFLLWSDIRRVDITSLPIGDSMLSIYLADNEAFFARMNPVKRALMRINARLAGGAPVNLPLQALDMDRNALLAAIRARLPAGPA